MADYVKKNSIEDFDGTIDLDVPGYDDEPVEPDFAIDVDEEDLDWDLAEYDGETDLDSEEAAAWEDGTLALLDEEPAEYGEQDVAPAEASYPGDDPAEPADDMATEELPDIEVPSDTAVMRAVGIEIVETEEIADPAEHEDADAPEVPGETAAGGAERMADAPEQGDAVRRHRTTLDYAIWALGAAAVILAGVAFLQFRQALDVRAETAQYQTLGASLAGIGTIGEDRIVAIKEARIQKDEDRAEAARAAAEKAELAANEGTVPVTMALSTVQSDLKIKIRDESQNLIEDVPFKVRVTLPSGKTAEYEDDDQDGMIYQTGLTKGTYKVTMEPLVASTDDDEDITETEEYKRYSQYKIPTDTQSIDITDKIAYTAIDVKDEIKTTAQVNVAAEDTQQKIATESEVQDTVEYVESTVESTTTNTEEDALYEEVSKEDIVDPNVSARRGLVIGNFRMLAEESAQADTGETGDDAQTDGQAESDTSKETAESNETAGDENSGDTETETENTDHQNEEQEKRAYTTTIKGDTSVAVEGTTLITASTDEPGATTYTWELDGDAATIDRTEGKTVTVTGKSEGTVTLTVTAHLVAEDADPAENTISTEIHVTVREEETSDKKLTVSPGSVTLAPNKTQSLSVTLEGVDDKSVTYESAAPLIAEVSGDGTITAVTAGETTVTVTANADTSLKQSVKVKVVETETNEEGHTLLKDKDGNQIYVKDNGTYREATAADYNKFETFYRKSAGKASSDSFKYTGWQNIGGKTYYFNAAGEPVTGSQVINGATYTFGADGALQSGTSKVGIDVSQWNGSIDWSSVAGSGVSYAIIRCGYRGSSTGALIRDPNFTTNIAGATAAGLKVGIYVFSQATNEVEAVEEASMAVELAAGYSVRLPIFIDVEAAGGRADGLSASARTTVVSAFCQTVQAAGYSAGVYSNTNWLSECLNTPALTSYHIWVAQYASSLSYARTRYDIWQYSSKGHVAGISGDVDMNMAYRSY